MKIEEITIKDLTIDKYNARGGEWVKDEELIDSIKSLGVLEPLLVRTIGKKYGIVCGSRRYNAAISAGLKTVPCVIRELNDFEALGTSLQENMQRGNLDSVQTSDAIDQLWKLMNGGKSYDDKMKEMKKRFGLASRTVSQYLSVSKLSSTVKKILHHDAIDIGTAEGISTAKWKENEKEEAAQILSRIDSGDKRRKILSKMKEYQGKLSPKKAYRKVKYEEYIKTYSWRPRALYLSHAMDTATKKWELNYDGVIEKCVEDRFRKEGFVKK